MKQMKVLAILMATVMLCVAFVGCTAAPAPAPAPEAPAAEEPAPEEPAPEEPAPEEPAPEESAPEAGAPTGDPISREQYKIPETYTKAKLFSGTYGFGDAEILGAMNDDESAFYFTWVAFDEDQVLEGTVKNGICMVTFDQTGFMTQDAQQIFDNALASEVPWSPITGGEAAGAPAGDPISREQYKIPETYTKAKLFSGTYGFGDAEILGAMNDDESAFYFTWVAFDEDQVLEGTVKNGICMVTFDQTGFMTQDAQQIFDNALASEVPWSPVQ